MKKVFLFLVFQSFLFSCSFNKIVTKNFIVDDFTTNQAPFSSNETLNSDSTNTLNEVDTRHSIVLGLVSSCVIGAFGYYIAPKLITGNSPLDDCQTDCGDGGFSKILGVTGAISGFALGYFYSKQLTNKKTK